MEEHGLEYYGMQITYYVGVVFFIALFEKCCNGRKFPIKRAKHPNNTK